MTSSFPGSLDSFSIAHADGVSEVIHAATINDLADAVNKIERHDERSYNVKDTRYNAVGDGSTDDSTAIQAAINDASSAGGGIVFFPRGVYEIKGTALTWKSNVHARGAGMGVSIIECDDSTNAAPIVSGSRTTANSTTLNGAVVQGARTIVLTSGTGYTVGDYIEIDGHSTAAQPNYLICKVVGVSGTTITIDGRIPCTFASGATVNRVTAFGVQQCSFQDLSFRTSTQDCATMTVRKSGCFSFNTGARDIIFTRCEFLGFNGASSGATIRLNNSYNISIDGCNFTRCGQSGLDTSLAECTVSAVLVTRIRVIDSTFYRCGASKTLGRFSGCVFVAVTGNEVGGMTAYNSRTSSGVGDTGSVSTDAGGRGVSFEDGTWQFSCTGNVFHDVGFNAVRVDGGIDGVVSSNTIFAAHDGGIIVGPSSIGNTQPSRDVVVEGNRVNFTSPAGDTTQSGIQLGGSGTGPTIRVTVRGNIVSNASFKGIETFSTGNGCTDCIIEGNIVNGAGSHSIGLMNAADTRFVITGNICRSTGAANSISTASSAGSNAVFGNIVDKAVTLAASDKKINDSAVADSNWVL